MPGSISGRREQQPWVLEGKRQPLHRLPSSGFVRAAAEAIRNQLSPELIASIAAIALQQKDQENRKTGEPR